MGSTGAFSLKDLLKSFQFHLKLALLGLGKFQKKKVIFFQESSPLVFREKEFMVGGLNSPHRKIGRIFKVPDTITLFYMGFWKYVNT